LSITWATAQSSKWVSFQFYPANTSLQKTFASAVNTDSSLLAKRINEVLLAAYEQGYLMAQDSAVFGSADSLQVLIQLGNIVVVKSIKNGNVPLEWMGNMSNKYAIAQKRAYKPREITAWMKQILANAENNGYPFASISLDSVSVDTLGISATLNMQKNALFYFDSIDFGGTARISKKFLQQYANFKPGMPYQEELIKNIDSRLSELPYVQVVRPMGIYFYGNKAKPYVYINQRKASSFDGVIGFAPNSSLNNKLVLTGDLNLKLLNLMGTGKNLELSYRGYLNNSQDLQIKFLWPYFLKTRFAIDYAFKLAKFDTTWLELYQDIGLQYRLSGNNYVKIYVQIQQISSLYTDTQFVLLNQRLPSNHSVNNILYGLALRKSGLDYYFNPRKGYLLELEGGAGTRTLVESSSIAQLKINGGNGETYSIYDSIDLKSVQYKFMGNGSYYQTLYKNFVLHTQLRGGLIANQNLFLSELFRIGGLKTLKGFDEQSIFADKFIIANIELKYLFQQNSGFVLFWNGAWYQNSVPQVTISDKPWGLGAGLNLETGAGIFSLYYAVGKQMGNPIEFQRAKVHFGLVNFF
jgi:outer membrane protein assembly factor BamA